MNSAGEKSISESNVKLTSELTATPVAALSGMLETRTGLAIDWEKVVVASVATVRSSRWIGFIGQ